MKIALTGDVMLGRLVDRFMIENRSVQAEQIWTDMLPILRQTDVRLANLECVISLKGQSFKTHFSISEKTTELSVVA